MKKLFCFLCCVAVFFLSSCDIFSDSNDESLSYISITQKPTKTSYYIGEDFDKTGLCVYAYYSGSSSSSKKDVTNLVSISGFDSSEKNYYLSITVSYTENGTTKSASFYVSINEIVLKYPFWDENRTVKVSFQYYRRETTADPFQKYIYSEDPTDDINGSVLFKIDAKKGVSYSVDDLITAYLYYPDNSSIRKTLYDKNEEKSKATKYIDGNEVNLTSKGGLMPLSYLFANDTLFNPLAADYGPSSIIGGAETLIFEDMVIKALRNTEYTSFKGSEYPIFETDANYAVTKATILKQVNDYFVYTLEIETVAQDVDINWPASLWGIDHFE